MPLAHHAVRWLLLLVACLSLSPMLFGFHPSVEGPPLGREVHQSGDEFQPLFEVRPQEAQEGPVYVQGWVPTETIFEIKLGALVPVVAPLEPSARLDQRCEGYLTGRCWPSPDQRHQRIGLEHYVPEVVVHLGPWTIRPGVRQWLIRIKPWIEPDALGDPVQNRGVGIRVSPFLETFARLESEGGYLIREIGSACERGSVVGLAMLVVDPSVRVASLESTFAQHQPKFCGFPSKRYSLRRVAKPEFHDSPDLDGSRGYDFGSMLVKKTKHRQPVWPVRIAIACCYTGVIVPLRARKCREARIR